MIPDILSENDQKILLELARKSIIAAVHHQPLPKINLADYSDKLQTNGASFVTLTEMGSLRGCIGALEPYQPLVEDVQEHAVAAALHDYRFGPVGPDEIPHLHIEISYLTMPQPLTYASPEELPGRLRPNIDGVILKDGYHSATFLPQVWEKIPDPPHFLSQLCQKMGAPSDLWKRQMLQVLTYQVQEFHE